MLLMLIMLINVDNIDNEFKKMNKNINVFDVYNYLKQIQAVRLKQLYFNRMYMIKDDKFTFLNRTCINTITQGTLMLSTVLFEMIDWFE